MPKFDVEQLNSNIGRYPGKVNDSRKVEDLLGDCVDILRKPKGSHPFQGIDETYPTQARREYIYFLSKVLEKDNENKTFSDDLSLSTINMQELLGEKGIKLYKAAIAEERDDPKFRDAVFLGSIIKEVHGEPYVKKQVMWVGGPSACGKSYNTENAIDRLFSSDGQGKKENKNTWVTVDGGVERELSQMRNLTLQIALHKEYTGINDLHKHTDLGIKGYVKAAAMKSKTLNLVIPSTFTRPHQNIKAMVKYLKRSATEQHFCEIKPSAGQEKNFQTTVFRQGNERAWASRQEFKKLGDEVTMNHPLKSESKAYNRRHFQQGKKLSALCGSIFRKLCGSENSFEVENDSIFIIKDGDNWRPCTVDDPAGERITARAFEEWQQEKTKQSPLEWLEQLNQQQPSRHRAVTEMLLKKGKAVNKAIEEPTVSAEEALVTYADLTADQARQYLFTYLHVADEIANMRNNPKIDADLKQDLEELYNHFRQLYVLNNLLLEHSAEGKKIRELITPEDIQHTVDTLTKLSKIDLGENLNEKVEDGLSVAQNVLNDITVKITTDAVIDQDGHYRAIPAEQLTVLDDIFSGLGTEEPVTSKDSLYQHAYELHKENKDTQKDGTQQDSPDPDSHKPTTPKIS